MSKKKSKKKPPHRRSVIEDLLRRTTTAQEQLIQALRKESASMEGYLEWPHNLVYANNNIEYINEELKKMILEHGLRTFG